MAFTDNLTISQRVAFSAPSILTGVISGHFQQLNIKLAQIQSIVDNCLYGPLIEIIFLSSLCVSPCGCLREG